MAWIAPVRGSMATAAPLSTPRSLCVSSRYAVSCARVLNVSTTFPPPALSPVNISLSRSANSLSLVPARNSFSLRSMPVAAPFTGLYPTTGAYACLSG
jgi:hypothetical protein